MSVWNNSELATTKNEDRLLPSQPYNTKLYNGNDFCGDIAKLLVHPEKSWDIKLKDGMTYAAMGSELNTLHFYQFLIRSHGFKKVLELGTYIGVSAMYMADAGAYVVTVEKGNEFFKIAQENIQKNGFNNIELWCQGADIYLKSSVREFGLILIDCAKEFYKELLELSLPRLAKNGIILVDDIFFQGDVFNNPPITEKGAGVKRMLDYVATLGDWEKVILPIGNGLMLLRRK